MKCKGEDCPIYHSGELNKLGYYIGCIHYPCHLTPADLPIIKAMLAGEWKCGMCVKNFDCPNPSVDIPCKIWQPKEEA